MSRGWLGILRGREGEAEAQRGEGAHPGTTDREKPAEKEPSGTQAWVGLILAG